MGIERAGHGVAVRADGQVPRRMIRTVTYDAALLMTIV
jgi:hypothetical protein